MRRWLRWRWVTVVVLVSIGAYLALDVIALQLLESRGAAQLAQATAAEQATLDLGSVPFLPSYLTGNSGEVDVVITGATGAGGLRVQEVRARLTDVRYSWRHIWSLAGSRFTSRTDIEIGEMIGAFELFESDLDDFIIRRVPLVDEVQVSSSGVLVYFEDLDTAPRRRPPQSDDEGGDDEEAFDPRYQARFLPRIEDNKLVLLLLGTSGLPSVFVEDAERIQTVIDLPRLPEGLQGDVRLGDGVVIVEVSGRDVETTIGEAER